MVWHLRTGQLTLGAHPGYRMQSKKLLSIDENEEEKKMTLGCSCNQMAPDNMAAVYPDAVKLQKRETFLVFK